MFLIVPNFPKRRLDVIQKERENIHLTILQVIFPLNVIWYGQFFYTVIIYVICIILGMCAKCLNRNNFHFEMPSSVGARGRRLCLTLTLTCRQKKWLKQTEPITLSIPSSPTFNVSTFNVFLSFHFSMIFLVLMEYVLPGQDGRAQGLSSVFFSIAF
jgi:hypothetical protein